MFLDMHSQLIRLREIFLKNGYPENFIDKCFKLFLNRFCIIGRKECYSCKQGSTISSSLWRKSLSMGYSTVVNYKVFSKVKMK